MSERAGGLTREPRAGSLPTYLPTSALRSARSAIDQRARARDHSSSFELLPERGGDRRGEGGGGGGGGGAGGKKKSSPPVDDSATRS